jgi:DtxR family Mn-dependent transcriptional regulator
MTPIMELSASLEDYLQGIYHIQSEKQAARTKDIAMRLKVNNSSVTGALRSLSEKGYINYAPYDLITLTEKGETYARDVIRRHEALKNFFTTILCVDEKEAEETACKMEHQISRTILDRMIQFVNFIQICPRAGEDWIKGFIGHSRQGKPYERCAACITTCLEKFKETQKSLEDIPDGGLFLEQLTPGQKGKVLDISGPDEVRKRITDMGISPGNIVEVEADDGSHHMMDINVRGYHISLRKEDAAKITVGLYRCDTLPSFK